MSGRLIAATVGALALLPGSVAGADSFTPVRLAITISQVARRSARLPVVVTVSADPGVLDVRDGALRLGVKLASECGATFETTPGVALLDQVLSPQPTAGQAYAATARVASGRPSEYGVQTVCTFLEDTGADRVYANDESVLVDVSAPCTSAANRYDRAQRNLRRAQRGLRHARSRSRRRVARRLVGRRQRTLRRDRRLGVASCGRGVSL